MQEELAGNVNRRLTTAMDTLKEKHRTGTNDVDDPDRAPTGPMYRQLEQQQQQQQHSAADLQKQKRLQVQQEKDQRVEELQRHLQRQQFGEDGHNANDSDADSDYDDLLDDDPVLDGIRQRRIQELRHLASQKASHLAHGHGQYRTIAQDEFLPECASSSSEYTAVHFFHREFQRCDIMDHHLKIIAEQHTTCKFVRIDAEKAPFFVTKLNIKTLPTVLVFKNGKTTDRLIGFEGLLPKDPNDPDSWETRRMQQWLAKTGAIEYMPSKDELREEMMQLGMGSKTGVRRGGVDRYDEDN
jgi:thiol-disulfide isomerase/thioredoxin